MLRRGAMRQSMSRAASRHSLGYSPNLLLKLSPPSDIDRIWVADITYIPLKERGFAYLALPR